MHGWLSFPFCLVIFGLAAAAEVDEVEQLCTQDVCGDVLETTLTDTGDSEAELLKVSMLQTVLSVGSRRELVDRGRGRADALSQGTGQAATATIQAQGQVLSDEPNHNTVASVERRSITSLAIPASDSPLTADSLSDEGAEVDKEVASLSQLNASRSTMSASACSGLIQAERLGATCIGGVSTLELRSQLDLLRLSGMFPPRNPQLVAQQVEVNPFAEQSLHFWSTKAGHEELIIAVYIMFYLVSMSLMYYWMINPPAHRGLDMSCQAKRIKTDIDVEEEVYRSSSLGWLSVSWASPWVARWGHSLDASRTKIKPGELPQMGSRENQSREAAVTFERLWEQEVREVGLENASVFRVLLQMWSYRTMAYMLFILICQVLVVQIYSVFLIESAMNYFHWLQAYVKLHGVYPDVSNTLLLSIVGFLTLPFSNIFFTSITSSVSCRLDQLTCGGLSIALFRKSQRLPAFTTTPKKEEDGEEEQPMGVTTDTEKESQADLMNLINYDVNTNLIGAYLVLCVATTTSIAFLALTALLWIRLHFATLFALGCAVPVLFFSAFFMGGLAGSFANLQTMIDKRIGVLREVLYGIRIVKGYAWESAMEEKVIALRKQEMTGLTTYFHYLGGLLGIFLGFPRVLVIAGLWGYSLLYGQHDVTTIFTCMQILSSLRWSCDVFIKALSQAILISPSIKRVEAFLRLQEAPLLPDSTPSWVKMWPGPQPESEALSDVDTPVESRLEVSGTYSWTDKGVPALEDIKISVPQGKLIGVVGSVGSGKSTFLQALLGELYPDKNKDHKVSRPNVVAYCSQVPHIAEGTLKENVLYGQALDAERYAEAINAASLRGDLAVLPGGDEVPIGSRGITLSGGQKARVAMARAAYHKGSELVIIDDPFGAVDAPTAKVILENLLLGPLMHGRTRVVTLQPDTDRLNHFDHLVVMEKGRVKEQGRPKEVMETEAYQSLLSSHAEVFTGENGTVAQGGGSPSARRRAEVPGLAKLREEEVEGRPTLEMMNHVTSLGGWTNLVCGSVFFTITIYLYLLCDLSLARWTNAMVLDPFVADTGYLLGYLFWISCALVSWCICWYYGECFSLGISARIHDMVVQRVLRAPIDRFFDKHPVGRILNRLSTDLCVVDLYFYVKGTGGCTAVYQALVPIIYVHTIMPWYLAVAAIPFYYMMSVFCMRFWNTTVPLRYSMSSARSDVSSLISDVCGNKVVIRAFQDQERMTQEMSDALDSQIKSGLIGDRVLRRWIVNRLVFMWSFYTTTMYMVGLLNAASIGAGTLGICLTNLLLVESNIDAYLDTATGAQFEFIALARLYEYLSVPQEKPLRKVGDGRFANIAVRVPRKGLGRLTMKETDDGIQVQRDGRPLLKDALDGTVLMAAGTGSAASLAKLCPSCEALAKVDDWHRLVAANDSVKDAKAMARELCGLNKSSTQQPSADIVLEVQSGWLLEGAHVQIEGLKAGYADIPRDVLKGLNLTFEKKQKVAIAGTTGCGKSSLLLALLRILEPRSGRILFNGTDISALGLATLRGAIGLVPQDPTLFSGTLRHNLDPFDMYSDGRIWQALRCVQLEDVVRGWCAKLWHQITDEGANLSFGQRQLVCLARMILRQPGLLLLDEATSAIDPNTQQLVQQTIKSSFPSSTLLAVAHRLETVLDFDYVVVMDHGDVAEQGPVKELTERKDGIFRKMLAAKGAW